MSAHDSHLLPPTEQPGLPGMPAPVFFESLEAKGDFTGERLHQQKPDTYKAIVVLLGQKLGVIRIGKLLGVSPNTVMAVRDREGATIEMVKQTLSDVAHNGALLASEAILETLNERLTSPHSLSIKDLKDMAVVYGILVQNGQLLAGQPTARVEMTELQKPQHDDFNRYLEKLPAAQVIDIAGPVSTGLVGEKSGVKEGACLAAASVAPSAIGGAKGAVPGAENDTVSGGKPTIP